MATKAQVAFSLDDDITKLIDEAAKHRGLTRAAYIRQLFFDALRREGLLPSHTSSNSTEAPSEDKAT